MNRYRALLVLLAGLGVGAFFWFDLGAYLTLEALKANRERLVSLYQERTLPFVLGFIGVYVLQTALSLPGAAVLSLAAGAVFGTLPATLYVNVGATAGAVLAFLLSRTLLRGWVVRRFGRRMEAIDRGLRESGLSYLLFLRLVPVFPFFLINLAAGLTGLPLRTYVLGTMLGILPGSFVYCNAGASLASIESLSQVTSPRVVGAFALLGAFALVPAVYRRVRAAKAA